MRNLRPHRFPPLVHLRAAVSRPAAEADVDAPSFTEGYQEGLDRGYREGYESGLDSGRQDGMAEGRSEGAAEGRRDALMHFSEAAAPVEAILESLKQVQHDYQSALRKEVVELVGKVARQVIRCELALQPVQMLALVDETLAAMPSTPEGVEVYLNPEELGRIRELDPERAARWNLIADPHMESGECRVRAGGHEADAGCRQRLSACIDQVKAQLLDAPESAEVSP